MGSPHKVGLELLDEFPRRSAGAAGGDGISRSSRPVLDELVDMPEWQLALRIAGSKNFSKSAYLHRFLLYVCEQQLTGRGDEINESRIGIHVFQRPHDYSPAEDNIVRNYARTLRKRIEEYFREEGKGETLRLTIPRGGYAPVFESQQHAVQEEDEKAPLLLETAPGDGAAAPAPPHAQGSPRLFLVPERLWIAAALLVGLLIGLVVAGHPWKRNAAEAVASYPRAHAVWAQMFQQNRDTLLVPADSGLGILENLTHQPASLADYASGAYFHQNGAPAGLDPGSITDLRTQDYTSVADLNIVSALSRLPEFDANHAYIRYTRAVSINDLKHSNAVLIGSVHTNPWVALFDNQLNFRLTYTPEVDRSFVANEHPAPGEQAVYSNESGASRHVTYGAIDFLPNLEGTGHVLILQGLNMAGTQAAADAILHSSEMEPALKRAILPDGSVRPFEILIETDTLGADAPRGQVVAVRVHAS